MKKPNGEKAWRQTDFGLNTLGDKGCVYTYDQYPNSLYLNYYSIVKDIFESYPNAYLS